MKGKYAYFTISKEMQGEVQYCYFLPKFFSSAFFFNILYLIYVIINSVLANRPFGSG